MTTARRTATALACLALLAGTAGCGEKSTAAPASTPTIIPTLPPQPSSHSAMPSTTPSTAGSADVLSVAAAEDVYRKAFQATDDIYLRGGLPATAPTDSQLAALMTGEALDGTMTLVKELKKNGITHVSGTNSIVRVQELKGYKHGDSQLALESCEDGRSLRNRAGDGTISPGQMSYVISTYKVVDGKVMMTYIDDSKTVATCPIA